MSTCNRLDLESLESWPTMPKNFPGMHCTTCISSLVMTIFTYLVDGAHAFNAKSGREAGRLPWRVNARSTQQIRRLHRPTPHVHHHLPKASSRSSHHSHHQLVHHGQGEVVNVWLNSLHCSVHRRSRQLEIQLCSECCESLISRVSFESSTLEIYLCIRMWDWSWICRNVVPLLWHTYLGRTSLN